MAAPDLGISREAAATPEVVSLPPREIRPVFTGSGSEYFRIWVVNTLLTLSTLGIYSAWAKVRRTRYLWQNTRLDGFAFDYHARPIAILRGRILALSLFGFYTYAFEFSRVAGIVALLLICALGPWLFMRSQQFKLANTSWRGLRFGFETHTLEAFRIVLPILLLWFSGTLGVIWYATDPKRLLAIQLPATLGIPWMHHRLKAYQHGRACYGDRPFSFHPVLIQFYTTYAKGFLLFVAGSLAGGICVYLLIDWAADAAFAAGRAPSPTRVGFFSAIILGITIFLFSWPYLAARIQQSVWSTTRLGAIHFRTLIGAGELFRLTLSNVFLTLVTLGLYWPFASMRLARYRIECLRLDSDVALGTIAAGTHASSIGAMGDGALDAFGLDLGL